MTDEALALRALTYWSLLPLLGLPISIIARRRGSPEFMNRLVVWMVVVPVFLGALYLGRQALTALMVLGCLGGALELARLGRPQALGYPKRAAILTALSLPWLALAYLGGPTPSWLALVALLLPLAGLRPLAITPPPWLPASAALSLGAGLYFWVAIAGRAQGVRWLVLAFTVVTVNDIFSAVFGKFIKSPRPFPSLSPGKSLAGYAGGALCALGAGFILAPGFAGTKPGTLAALMIILVVAGNAGDLFASWIKRNHGRKDFGRLLGAMGGVLDRLDSLLPAGVVLFIILALLKAI